MDCQGVENQGNNKDCQGTTTTLQTKRVLCQFDTIKLLEEEQCRICYELHVKISFQLITH